MSGLDRWRRYRARRENGDIFAMADIPASLACTLIEMGYLSEQDGLANPRACGEALVKFAATCKQKL